mmetsp:Transcript_1238/g.3497  ORF Transcript_1238/g.3497 Transcript_1238/m.3497 type:complete len:425 (+) Transcript_1238:105-1379(+)
MSAAVYTNADNDDDDQPTTTTTMTALAATHFGPPRDCLTFHHHLPMPTTLSPTQLLIRVDCTDVNPVDVQKLQQQQPDGTAIPAHRSPLIVGFGGCGRIVQVGADVPPSDKDHDFAKGRRVVFLCDASRNGSYATHVAVDWRLVCTVPTTTTTDLPDDDMEEEDEQFLAQLASIPVAGCTAMEALEKVGLPILNNNNNNDNSNHNNDSTPQTLLIVGGAGGVGSWATVLARAAYPHLRIVHTASTPDDTLTKRWCLETLGANQVIAHDQIDTALPNAGRVGSVDAVVCLSEPHALLWNRIVNILRPFAQVCLVVAGDAIRSLDLSFCFFKSAAVHTKTVFSHARAGFPHGDRQGRQLRHVVDALCRGQIRAPLNPHWEQVVGSRDWTQVLSSSSSQDEAGGVTVLDQIASGHTMGKLVMKITSS